MNKRWLLVLTAVVGLGLLAVPLFVRRPAPVGTSADANPLADVPELRSADAPKCQTGKSSKLDFVLKDRNGADVHLTDYRGKVVLVNFWATWCGPCKVEIPDFVELYAQYKDRGFVILGVLSQDTPTKDQLTTFLAENRMDYPIFNASEKFEGAFGELWALPTTFLIDRQGAVCAQQVGPASKDDVERSLKSLL